MEATRTDIESAIATFKALNWKEMGRDSANALSTSDLADCGYTNPSCGSTAWSDDTPREAGELEDLDEDGEFSDEIEEAINAAKDAYNDGFNETEEEAIEELAAERKSHLDRATKAGWRICVFGLPGSQTHVVRVAAPGTANDVSDEIFTPGPVGPYESSIHTPSDADEMTYQDGTKIYGGEVDEILSEVE